jgi:UV DNA damage endonuclease
MLNRIGYASLCIGCKCEGFKSLRKENANDENLKKIIKDNLSNLESIIDYNIEMNIKFFRISSDIIPFGSSDYNNLEWWNLFNSDLKRIGRKIIESNMRVSMHPGQYTVLNSPKDDVVNNSIKDLSYHNRFLDSLGLDYSSKIILHIGGVYSNKVESMNRFCENFHKLEAGIKKRLIIENDDKLYNIKDVLDISNIIEIPVVFDNLHHNINKASDDKCEIEWIKEAIKTWSIEDGKPKMHFSLQAKDKKIGAHSSTINLYDFEEFYLKIKDISLDIMLEVKDKNLSCIKCNNLVNGNKILELEKEWARYKYSVLEKSPNDYKKIRELLKNKESFPVKEFYAFIDSALEKEFNIGYLVNAATHVWGYFKDISDEMEKDKFFKNLEKFESGIIKLETLKKHLKELAFKYNIEYLINSLYFHI